MKTVHIQTNLPSSGNAAFRLHNAFIENNISSIMISRTSDTNDLKGVYFLGFKYQILSRVYSRINNIVLRNVDKKWGLFSNSLFSTNISKMKILNSIDVIYLHWINDNYLNLKNIKKLTRLGKPIVIFMHDMWTITGGCHHSFECEKYKSFCSSCQMFKKKKRNDLASKQFKKKVRLFNEYDKFYFVSPSKWLYNCAKESLLLKNKPVFHIPNIIDKKVYKPFDKKTAKHILNIDLDSNVICFGATSINSPYKGLKYLIAALKKIAIVKSKKKITLLIFGSGNIDDYMTELPFEIKYVGTLKDDYSIVLLYNASDVFVTPSLADNLPTTVMESLSCGVPVVGFHVGGISDMIMHKKNGYLSEYKNIDDLAFGISYCLNNDLTGNLPPEFEKKLLIEKHIQLLNRIKNI